MTSTRNHELHDDFPVLTFSPGQLMPVQWINEKWSDSRVDAWDRLFDRMVASNRLVMSPKNGLLVFSLIMVLIMLRVEYSMGVTEFVAMLNNPLLLIFGTSTVFLTLKTRKVAVVAERYRNRADKSISETVKRWAMLRYGVEVNVTETLPEILVGQQVRPPKNSGYWLSTTTIRGETFLIVTNEHSELPVQW